VGGGVAVGGGPPANDAEPRGRAGDTTPVLRSRDSERSGSTGSPARTSSDESMDAPLSGLDGHRRGRPKTGAHTRGNPRPERRGPADRRRRRPRTTSGATTPPGTSWRTLPGLPLQRVSGPSPAATPSRPPIVRCGAALASCGVRVAVEDGCPAPRTRAMQFGREPPEWCGENSSRVCQTARHEGKDLFRAIDCAEVVVRLSSSGRGRQAARPGTVRQVTGTGACGC
jgi:hypothetical protein